MNGSLPLSGAGRRAAERQQAESLRHHLQRSAHLQPGPGVGERPPGLDRPEHRVPDEKEESRMKYLIVCVHPRDGSTVIMETDDKMEAVRECNMYNALSREERYTIYQEAEI